MGPLRSSAGLKARVAQPRPASKPSSRSRFLTRARRKAPADRQIFRGSAASSASRPAQAKKTLAEPHAPHLSLARRLASPAKLFWPRRGHGYPIARRATLHHTIPGPKPIHTHTHTEKKKTLASLHLRSPGPRSLFQRFRRSPEALPTRCPSRPWPPSGRPPPAPAGATARVPHRSA